VTTTLWAMAAVLALSAALCVWAALTGRPDSAPTPQHAAWGETAALEDRDDQDLTEVIRVPIKRWYDEDPWPYGRPHGWGETRH
jgi:hypothetical protein